MVGYLRSSHEVDDQLQVAEHNDRGNNTRKRRQPRRRDKLAHLAALGRDHHKWDDREG